jgi:hypothetical protein
MSEIDEIKELITYWRDQEKESATMARMLQKELDVRQSGNEI